MDALVNTVLEEYDVRGAREREVWSRLPPDELERRRDEFLLGVGPATGALLNLLAREAGAQTIVELGTSYGYSTIWLAEAARATGGRVISMDLSAGKQAVAAEALERAGLVGQVEFRCGDAVKLIAAAGETFDLVLLDIWKDLYVPCFDALLPKLAPGALLVADNMSHPPSAALDALRYRKHVAAAPELDSVLLSVGSGLLLSRHRAP